MDIHYEDYDTGEIIDEMVSPCWVVKSLDGTVVERSVYADDMASVDVFATANQSVTVDGEPAYGSGSSYYGEVGVEVVIALDIVDADGTVQTQLDQDALVYPPILKIPVVKFVGGAEGTETDEIYFNATLVAGRLSATGTIPTAGNWKFLISRINQSIAAIDPTWSVDGTDATFLV